MGTGERDVMQGNRRKTGARALGAGAILLVGLFLSGCSSPIADMPSLDLDALVRPREPGGYLPVNDVPRERAGPVISPEERAKLEKELLAARDRQAAAGTGDRPK